MRRGFTLIEVIVAVAVASLLALTAHRVFGAGVAAARSLAEARRAADRAANVRRLLGAAFLSLEVDAAGQPFEGHADRVRFATWLETADGWFEPVAMDLRLDGRRLVAGLGGRPPIVLADSMVAVQFDYLLEWGADERWTAAWVSQLSAPIAVRLRTYRSAEGGKMVGDTTLFQIKARK